MELREPHAERTKRVLSIGLALVVAVFLGFIYLRISEWRGAPSCRTAYAMSRTASDTALVDAQRSGATMGRVDAAYNVSCGELRLRGKLR